MKKRIVYLFCQQNGAVTAFKKSFMSSASLPTVGTIIALGTEGEPPGTLRQGVVRSVRETENFDELKVGTDVPTTKALRECLIKGYEETPLPTW